MSVQSFRLPYGFSGEVRLFPLPDLVMYPSNVLPLHIFESRYREMLEDAIRGDGLITIATLTPGYERDYYSRPAIASAVCVGRVVAHEKTKQGTYNLMLAGLKRARVKHEIEPVRAFRRAAVELIDDLSLEVDNRSRKLGEQLAERFLGIVPSAREFFEPLMQRAATLALITDIVAFHLPLDTELKLQLLAEADPVHRAKVLLDNLPATTTKNHPRRRYPPDFSAN